MAVEIRRLDPFQNVVNVGWGGGVKSIYIAWVLIAVSGNGGSAAGSEIFCAGQPVDSAIYTNNNTGAGANGTCEIPDVRAMMVDQEIEATEGKLTFTFTFHTTPTVPSSYNDFDSWIARDKDDETIGTLDNGDDIASSTASHTRIVEVKLSDGEMILVGDF